VTAADTPPKPVAIEPGTIRGRTIICLANRWDYDPTSKHQVMKVLSRRNQILWVNYRGTRTPRATASDLAAVLATLRHVLGGVRRVSDSIVQMTPLVVPGGRTGWRGALNRRLLVAQIRRALAALPRQPVQLWTFAPDVADLAGEFDEECLIYYCVDEYSAFEDFDGPAIRAAEDRLIRRADAVITTSASLYESRRQRHPATYLVRHGVDVRHFARALEEDTETPPEIADLPRPVFGFFGLLQHWFDVRLMAQVARARPDASFVLLGECQADVAALQTLPNVHLLGRQPYATLPAWCRAFDAALLPFRINEMTVNINPIKLREYLAAGLPVISTALPEVRRYEPDVLIAHDAAEFCRHCDVAAALSSPEHRRRRSAMMNGESWETVVERLSWIVQSALGRGDPAAQPPPACPPPVAPPAEPELVGSAI